MKIVYYASQRPTVSAINLPTYKLARFLVANLEALTSDSTYTIKNFADLIQKIKEIRLQSNDILVSFDIMSFLPKYQSQVL